MSVLLVIQKPEAMGRLLQVITGEGKTLIIRLIAAYFAKVKGYKVDVVTSSKTLAERDAASAQTFMKSLGLTVGYLSENPKPKEVGADVLYGTTHTFCCMKLNNYQPNAEELLHRRREFLIVDEVDSMLIDKPQNQTIISRPSTFAKETKIVYQYIWMNLKTMLILYQKYETEVKEDDIKESLRRGVSGVIGRFRSFKTRRYLNQHLDTWIANALKAMLSMQNNVDYVITPARQVKIIDRDTGETQQNSKWTKGLHHFIELKHLLNCEGVTSTSFFEHHVNFFLSYKNNIVGVTGTLGSKVCAEFLKDVYNVDCLRVPTFKQKKFFQMDPFISQSNADWFENIQREVQVIRNQDRPTLVIFENIKVGLEFSEHLSKKNIAHRQYLRSDIDSPEEIIKNLKSDSIIVATNLAGRGTDIRIPPEVSARGGLHVVLTFLASNLRVEKQAFGRTARKGQFGTGRLILSVENDPFLKKYLFMKILNPKVGQS